MKKLLFLVLVLVANFFIGCQKDENQPPLIEIENPQGENSVLTGTELSLVARVTSAVNYSVSWSVNGVLQTDATTETFVFKQEQAGEYKIEATATNKNGAATAEITITVEDFLVEIENLSGENTVVKGTVVSLAAKVTAPEDYAYKIDSWSINDIIVANANNKTFDFKGDEIGEYKIEVSATMNGSTATDTIIINVVEDLYVIDFESDDDFKYVATGHTAPDMFEYVNQDIGLRMSFNAPYQGVDYWVGVAISQFNDMVTVGYGNQLSVYYKNETTGGGGYNGSKTFAVAYYDAWYVGDKNLFIFDDEKTEKTFDSFWVTNSTFAALEMKDGGFGKEFTYKDGDWFKLIINAFDNEGHRTGETIEFYLADFRTASSSGIITEWTRVDLRPLGNRVNRVEFELDSSDKGMWGMNTPAYFCFDNLVIIK